MTGDEGERGQSGLQVLFLGLLKLEFFSLVYLLPFWSRRVSNEREKKMGDKDPSVLSVCKLQELAPSPRIHLLIIILNSNILLLSGRYWIYRSTGTAW